MPFEVINFASVTFCHFSMLLRLSK